MGACACGAHAPHDKIMIYAGGCIAAEKEGKMKNDVKGAEEEVAAADAAALPAADAPPYGKLKNKYFYRFVKRTFDIVSSGLLLIFLSWLIVIVLFIKWAEDAKNSAYELVITPVDDADAPAAKHAKRLVANDGRVYDCLLRPRKKHKGEKVKKSPVYSSVRVGKDGKRFKFYKIRSMCPGAEDMKDALIAAGLNEADPPAFKIKDDPRITPFGRFLRKTSLDELLQLLNILRGDMSVVGPRPPLPNEVSEYTPYQMHRLDVKGGLLCLWQIQPNRNSLSFDDWVRLDLEYIQKRSLRLDLKILVKGAYMVIFDHSGE